MGPDYEALAVELLSDDLARLDDAAAADALNTQTVSSLAPGSYVAEGGILRVLGPDDGHAALSAIEAAADAGDGISVRVVRILRDVAGGGIDVGDPVTHAMLDQYEAGGVLSAGQVAGLKAYGTRTTTRAGSIAGWGVPVTAADVAHARSL